MVIGYSCFDIFAVYVELSYVFYQHLVHTDYFQKTRACGFGKPALLVLGHVHVNVDAAFEGVRVLAGPDWFQAPHMTIVSADGGCERLWLTPDGAARAPRYPL